MKIALSLVAIFLFSVTSSAQSRTISKDEYETVFDFAVSKTNDAYPVILKVTTVFIEHSKRVRTVTELNENESLLHRRIKRTTVVRGRTKDEYQVSVGFAQVFCSDDGRSWKASKNECYGPVSLYGPRDVESSEYSVNVKSSKGKRVKVYREYSVFAPAEGSEKKEFRETVSTIDSRGFFTTVVDREGTLDPRRVALIRKQSWVTRAKIKPVVAPTQAGQVHTPVKGSSERKAIVDALRKDYIQPHKGKLTFKVTYLKVHGDWAWLFAEPISSDPHDWFGETYGFLMHKAKGEWRVMDLPEMVEDPNDPEKLEYPNPADVKEIKKKYPTVPTDIFPKYRQ